MSVHGTISRADKPSQLWRLYAPPPLSRTLVVDALLLVPAIAGTVWAWRWGVTMALLIPGLALSQVFGASAARARGIVRPRRPTVTMTVILMAVLFVVFLLTESITPRYAAPLVLVVGVILVLVPIWHAMLRRMYEA